MIPQQPPLTPRFSALYLQPLVSHHANRRETFVQPFMVDQVHHTKSMALEAAGIRHDGDVFSRDAEGRFFKVGTHELPTVAGITQAWRRDGVFCAITPELARQAIPAQASRDVAKATVLANLNHYQTVGAEGFPGIGQADDLFRMFGQNRVVLPKAVTRQDTLAEVMLAVQLMGTGLMRNQDNLLAHGLGIDIWLPDSEPDEVAESA